MCVGGLLLFVIIIFLFLSLGLNILTINAVLNSLLYYFGLLLSYGTSMSHHIQYIQRFFLLIILVDIVEIVPFLPQ